MRELRVGDVVQVNSEGEILASLDGTGAFEGVVFMPEMRKFCGKKLRVFKRAEKVCTEGGYISRMSGTVFLEGIRCDGEYHDGCQRMCLIFWKEQWLTRMPAGTLPDPVPRVVPIQSIAPLDKEKVYSCQSTNIWHAIGRLNGFDLRLYGRDIMYGNLSLRQVAKLLCFATYNMVMRRMRLPEYGAAIGKLTTTPKVTLDLQPGEQVEVLSRKEIEATLDPNGKNRGLSIDHEMLRHSGRRFRVSHRVRRIILEDTGKMREIHDTVALENLTCEGLCRLGCSRNSFPMWREAWLKRTTNSVGSQDHAAQRRETTNPPTVSERDQ